jgi:tetratricopeptide (TPR) repeat protein
MVSSHPLRALATPRGGLSARLLPRQAEALLIVWLLALPITCSAQTREQAAMFSQATQAMQEGNLEAAGAGFAAVVKQAPTFAEAHFNLGLVRQEQGQYQDAIASFHKALALRPHLHGANLFLGISSFRINHLDEASAASRKKPPATPKTPTPGCGWA